MKKIKQMRKKWIKFLTLFSLYLAKKKLQRKDSLVTPFYNLVNSNQKFVFNKYLSCLVIYSAFYFGGCSQSTIIDLPCNDTNIAKVVSLSCSPSIIEVGQPCSISAEYQLCNDYFGKFARLGIKGPLNGSSAVIIIDTTIPHNTQFYTEYFSHTFTQPGNYTLWFSISKSYNTLQNPGTNFRKELNVTVIGDEMNNFKIIELSMVNDELWPNYSDQNANPPFNYNGKQKRNKAFLDAGTSIETVNEIKNLSAQIFTANDDFNYWAIEKAGGDRNKPGYDLDYNTAIICGIEDIQPLPEYVYGIAWQQGDFKQKPAPARATVLFSRMKQKGYSDKLETLFINGTAIHEMGHARGIKFDGWNIVPPHGGTDLSHCIMWGAALPPSINPPDQTCDFFEPYFCESHRNFLMGITWNPNLKIATEEKNVSD